MQTAFILGLAQLFPTVLADAVPCLTNQNHTSCRDLFGTNGTGCCALNDPDAVCCLTPLVGPTGPIIPGNKGLNRSYCCPSGTTCSERGCKPQPSPTGFGYLCGPTQGHNCNVSYLCTSGPSFDSFNHDTDDATVLVVGDSVSNGWTPVLRNLLQNLSSSIAVTHSPGAFQDGGARSTSNFVKCFDYLFKTAELEALPLKKGDRVLINFGLHDYNEGQEGVREYTLEYRQGLIQATAIADAAGANITILGTTPCHNCAPGDDETVKALNVAAQAIASEFGLPFVDLYTPLISRCGPVPWADTGANACALCAPKCKSLSVHYLTSGYDVIARLIANATHIPLD